MPLPRPGSTPSSSVAVAASTPRPTTSAFATATADDDGPIRRRRCGDGVWPEYDSCSRISAVCFCFLGRDWPPSTSRASRPPFWGLAVRRRCGDRPGEVRVRRVAEGGRTVDTGVAHGRSYEVVRRTGDVLRRTSISPGRRGAGERRVVPPRRWPPPPPSLPPPITGRPSGAPAPAPSGSTHAARIRRAGIATATAVAPCFEPSFDANVVREASAVAACGSVITLAVAGCVGAAAAVRAAAAATAGAGPDCDVTGQLSDASAPAAAAEAPLPLSARVAAVASCFPRPEEDLSRRYVWR
jgi:hypothetical protein